MNGLLVINKEKDYTSRDVVNILEKKFDTPKVGHTGTLDPIATGVLVIALGNALKIVDLLSCDAKEYIATASIGVLTDTLDTTGNILKEEYKEITKEELEKVLNSFLGESIQEVPLYSAVKVNGKRLYEYARLGNYVELPKRNIKIYDIELLELNKEYFKFRVVVSKGTYIRALIRDIGIKLNTYLSMSELIRTKQGMFSIDNSYTIDDVLNDKYEIIKPYKALTDFEIVEVNDYIKNKVLNGRILENRYTNDKIAFIDKDKNLIGLYKPYSKDIKKIKPIKIIKPV